MKHNLFKIRKHPQLQKKNDHDNSQLQEEQSQKNFQKISRDGSNRYLEQKMQQIMGMFDIFLKNSLANSQSSSPITHKNYETELDPRDKHPILPLPKIKNNSIDENDLKDWLTQLCSTVFSISFNFFLSNKLSLSQAKIFTSESIFINLLNLSKNQTLTNIQMGVIDKHIKQKVLLYLQKKYPLTEQKDANLALDREIVQMDHMDLLENDYLNMFGIMFQYRESGNYNDYIMKVINKIMKSVDEKCEISRDELDDKFSVDDQTTNFKYFQHFMTNIFEKCFDEDLMMNRQPEKILIEKNESTSLEFLDRKAMRDKRKQQYKQKVKSYTNFKIGKKISPNSKIFSEQQILGRNLAVKDPTLLRILTKWCSQIEKKYRNDNYFKQKVESIQLQKSEHINPFFKWMKKVMDDLMAIQKIEINKFLEQIEKNCYDQQATLILKSLRSDGSHYIRKVQQDYGKFSNQMSKSFHSYLILYLNRLIHGLLTVSKNFYEKKVKKTWEDWTPAPPNLVSLNIGDFLRCQCSSGQKQILKIFKQIKMLSQKNPQKLKIIRIKNRLKKGTNDILINIKFNNSIICEIQLAVNSSTSKFIQCSNSFGHFLYELERSLFGPILQLSNIWNNSDARASEFQLIASKKFMKRNQIQIIQDISCGESQGNHKLEQFQLPFECSLCNKFYFSNNYFLSNKKCTKCNYFRCIKCQIDLYNPEQFKKLIFKSKYSRDNCQSYNKIQSKDKIIPRFGYCFAIQSKEILLEYFNFNSIEGTEKIIGIKNDQLYQIKKLKSNQDYVEFLNSYCVFEIPEEKSHIFEINEKKTYKFNVEQYIRQTFRQEKQVLILTQVKLAEHMEEIINKTKKGFQKSLKKIKRIEYTSNQQKEIPFLQCFQNVSVLNLSYNNIQNTDEVCKFKHLEQLQMKRNKNLDITNPELCKMKKLQSLRLDECNLTELPPDIGNLKNLKILKLTNNKIKTLPKYFTNLEKLQQLYIRRNQLQQLPQDIQKLINLQILSLSYNYLKKLPQKFAQLKQLNTLKLDNNKFVSLPDIQKLEKLQRLHISFNEIEEISPQLNLKNLVSLNMRKNKLKQLPQIFEGMMFLEYINVEGNNLSKIPQTLGKCTSLQYMNFNNNQIEQISEDILNMKVFSTNFQFIGNKLKQVPKWLLSFHGLKSINLSKNCITSIPPEISGLTELSSLIFSFNKLTEIDNQIVKLKKITSLSFDNNYIKQITPQFITFVQKNKNINFTNLLKHNQISQFNEILMEKDGIIMLLQNRLQQIPISLSIDKLLITEINFENNLIAQIPSQIVQFASLKILNLKSNQIKKIPSCLSQLENLIDKKLILNDNPIELVQCVQFVFAKGSKKTNQFLGKFLNTEKLASNILGLVNKQSEYEKDQE